VENGSSRRSGLKPGRPTRASLSKPSRPAPRSVVAAEMMTCGRSPCCARNRRCTIHETFVLEATVTGLDRSSRQQAMEKGWGSHAPPCPPRVLSVAARTHTIPPIARLIAQPVPSRAPSQPHVTLTASLSAFRICPLSLSRKRCGGNDGRRSTCLPWCLGEMFQDADRRPSPASSPLHPSQVDRANAAGLEPPSGTSSNETVPGSILCIVQYVEFPMLYALLCLLPHEA